MQTKILTCVHRVYVRRNDNYNKILEKRFFSCKKAVEFMNWCQENIKNVDVQIINENCEDTITINENE